MKKLALALLFSSSLMGTACAAEESAPESAAPDAVVATAPAFEAAESSWRDVDPENTLYIDTDYGRIIVELYPEIAPLHVAQIKTLASARFYDLITFHRVIDGFMNQTGDPKGDGTGGSHLPNIPGEFTFRRGGDMAFTPYGERVVNPREPSQGVNTVGFYKGLPISSQPSAQMILTKDGKVVANGLHCKGVTSMARSSDPNSANSQFFLMRGAAPWLDRDYSVWGTTVLGHEHLTKFKDGDKGQDPNFVPDAMKRVRLAADLPEEERVPVQVLKTDSPEFIAYLESQTTADGSQTDICDIHVPTRLKP